MEQYYKKDLVNSLIDDKISTIDKYIQDRTKIFLSSYEKNSIDWNENVIDCINCTDNEKKKWTTRMLLESTPRGNIVLMYDIEKQAFNYYMDTSGVSYTLLNAVAMKFVLTFRCRDLFIDENIIPIDTTSPLITASNLIDKKEIDEKKELINNLTNSVMNDLNSPFAKLKSRNPKKVRFDSTDIELKKMKNKFINQGKIMNLIFHQKSVIKKVVNANITSYKSYKRMWQEDEPIRPTYVSHKVDFDHSYYIGDLCGIDGIGGVGGVFTD
jgi:predicted hydrolase (HD superfamily)